MSKATTSVTDFQLSPGLRVCGARYLLKRLIGRAEFSELWLARDIKNTRDVALKFLPKPFLQDTNLLEFFREEVSREKLLKHPHIVQVYELAHDYDSLAIAMEFVDGWSLATLKIDKPDRRHTVSEIAPWLRELCDALTFAHDEFGILHGNLKPSNLLLSGRDGIKVSDFGFAAHIRNECSKRGIAKSGYAGIGYLSPQQVMGESPARADDIYSLGAVIFDLVTGTPPFYKGEILTQICSLKPPRMGRRLTELGIRSEAVPPSWEEAVAACLEKSPSDRPGTVEEVLRLLERPELKSRPNDFTEAVESASSVTDQNAGNVESTSPTTPVRPESRRLAPVITGIAAAFVIVVAVAAYWFARSGQFASVVAAGHLGTSAGSFDNSFKAGTGADNTIWCLTPLTDGKILIGGVFKSYNGVADSRIVRLEPDGELDQSFVPQVAGDVSTIAPLDDGEILIGGLGLIAGHPGKKLVRLNADGSFDDSFDGETYNRAVVTVDVQADGKVLAGGRFTIVAGKRHSGLVRLTADGKLDDSFAIGSGASAAVLGIAVQPDRKIMVAGEFRKFNNHAAGHLVRLNPDGSFDTGFDDGAGADASIWSIQLQKGGKIYISGSFKSFDGSPCAHIARLNPDGSLDTNFHAPDGLATDVRCLSAQPDGKLVVGGYLTVNDSPVPVLVRLNGDGSLDQTFHISGATGDTVWGARIQPDGKILVAGRFSSLDGVLCGNIARLQN